MKKHVQLFEEFLTDPAQEALLKKQFQTNPVTGNIPVTHSVSQIVSDEKGMHVHVGDQTQVAAVIIPDTEKQA